MSFARLTAPQLKKTPMKRLDFIKTNLAALGGALLAGGLPVTTRAIESAASRHAPGKAAIKLGMRVSPWMSDQHLEFMRQLELGWCRLDVHEHDFGYEALARTQERYAKHGLRIFTVFNYARLTPPLASGRTRARSTNAGVCPPYRRVGPAGLPGVRHIVDRPAAGFAGFQHQHG